MISSAYSRSTSSCVPLCESRWTVWPRTFGVKGVGDKHQNDTYLILFCVSETKRTTSQIHTCQTCYHNIKIHVWILQSWRQKACWNCSSQVFFLSLRDMLRPKSLLKQEQGWHPRHFQWSSDCNKAFLGVERFIFGRFWTSLDLKTKKPNYPIALQIEDSQQLLNSAIQHVWWSWIGFWLFY